LNEAHFQSLPAPAKRIVVESHDDRAHESKISKAIEIVLGDRRYYPDVALHPNETGVLVDPQTTRYVRFGAGGKGGGDFIGIFKRADGIGLFIEAEIKRKRASSVQSEDQRARERLVTAFGGSYRVLRSVEDAERWIADLRGGGR
jgi:hypothetical protein